MKTNLTHLIAFLFILFAFQAEAQSDPVLTLVTSLKATGSTQLSFQPSGELEIAYWNKDIVEVQIYIEDESFSKQRLKALIPIGFYRIASEQDGDILKVFMPNQSKEVRINGKQVNNSLKFRLKMPQNMLFISDNTENELPIKTF